MTVNKYITINGNKSLSTKHRTQSGWVGDNYGHQCGTAGIKYLYFVDPASCNVERAEPLRTNRATH